MQTYSSNTLVVAWYVVASPPAVSIECCCHESMNDTLLPWQSSSSSDRPKVNDQWNVSPPPSSHWPSTEDNKIYRTQSWKRFGHSTVHRRAFPVSIKSIQWHQYSISRILFRTCPWLFLVPPSVRTRQMSLGGHRLVYELWPHQSRWFWLVNWHLLFWIRYAPTVNLPIQR